MARVSMTLALDADSVAAGRASFAALNALLKYMSATSLARFDALHDELAGKPGLMITSRASEGNLILEPSERYLEDVRACAADTTHKEGLFFEIEYRHGWPILSIGAASSVAEKHPLEQPELSNCSPSLKAATHDA